MDITAVVTVTDDGGSSGRLRRDFAILPPGDIRNCMVALSEDEALLSRLFQYRFASGRGLPGHSFGNLFLTAMHQITGDFAHAVRESSEILAIRGRIFPATDANVTLSARLVDGREVTGESTISKAASPSTCVPSSQPLEAAARDAQGHRECRSHHPGARLPLHQRDSNLLVSGIPRRGDLTALKVRLRQSHVAAGRNHQPLGLASRQTILRHAAGQQSD